MAFRISGKRGSKEIELEDDNGNVLVFLDGNLVAIFETDDEKHSLRVYKGSLKEEGITLETSND